MSSSTGGVDGVGGVLVLVLSGSRGLFGVPLGLPLRRLTGLLSEDACVAVLSPCTWCAGKDWDFLLPRLDCVSITTELK